MSSNSSSKSHYFKAFGRKDKKKPKRISFPRATKEEHKKNKKNAAAASSSAALLIGIEYVSYARQRRMSRLEGCHDDVRAMQRYLKNVHGVRTSNMTVLTDGNLLPSQAPSQPTKRNIMAQLEAHLKKLSFASSQNSDTIEHLFVTYSGHGSYALDYSGDEDDGYDECLVPCDYLEAGLIKDDDIRDLLVKHFPANNKNLSVTFIFDCCHSGTMCDLPITYTSQNINIGKVNRKYDALAAREGQIVCLSACKDQQTSLSVFGLNWQDRKWQGLMTYVLTSDPALKEAKRIDGKTLIETMDRFIKRKGYDQVTVLSSNRKEALSCSDIVFPHF